MYKYLGGACRDLKCPSLLVGGVEDHVRTSDTYGTDIAFSENAGVATDLGHV